MSGPSGRRPAHGGRRGRVPGTASRPYLSARAWRVLDEVRAHRRATRAEITAASGLAWATVSKICDELREARLLRESGTHRTARSGPESALLEVEGSAGYFVGVEVGVEHVRTRVVDFAFDVQDVAVDCRNGAVDEQGPRATLEATLTNVTGVVSQVLREAGDRYGGPPLGLGFAWPGVVDSRRGRFRYSPYIEFQSELSASDLMRPLDADLLADAAVVLDHDSACVALAEKYLGGRERTARPEEHFAVVYRTTGLGLGLVVDGDVHRGANDAAGELGHLVVNLAGVKCACGRVGCLETETTDTALVDKYLGERHGWERSDEQATGRHARPTVATLVATALEGDQRALDVLTDLGDWLGKGLGYVVNLFDPELIVVTMGDSGLYDLCYPRLRGKLEETCWRFGLENLRIERSRLGNGAAAIGAAIGAYRRVQTMDR